MNRILTLCAFMAAFMFTTPAFAQPPEEAKAPAAEEAKAAPAEEAKAAPAEDAKAEDAKAEDAKAEDAKAEDAKAEDAKDGGDTAAKADEKAAPAEIKTEEEAVEAASSLLSALQDKQWALAVGLGLTLLVFGLRKIKVLAKVPSKALPWVTAGLGIVGYVAAALMVDGADLLDAALGGLMTGAAAVGLWEMVLKNFLGGSKTEAAS